MQIHYRGLVARTAFFMIAELHVHVIVWSQQDSIRWEVCVSARHGEEEKEKSEMRTRLKRRLHLHKDLPDRGIHPILERHGGLPRENHH